MRSLYSFVILPGEKRTLAAQAAILLCCLRVLLAVLRLKQLQGFAASYARGLTWMHKTKCDAEAIVWAVSVVARRLHFTCLVNAIAAQSLLAAYGFQSQLHIGVTCRQGAFAAHAWVERDNEIVIGGPAASVAEYTPLTSVNEVRL